MEHCIMHFTSTRSPRNVTSAQAIARGLAEDGGLFIPSEFPKISDELIDRMIGMNYKARAREILPLYLTDFTADEIARSVEAAYTGTFDNENPAPLVELTPGLNILELWHGPTCAFKDMALQLLPHLLTLSARKAAPGRTMVILTATSGDTGKAALDGFADVPGTKIIVFYPQNGVSSMQKLQMVTQKGDNVAVCAIEGNFDDAQNGVKKIFSDQEMKEYLNARDMEFSSANSINFGRLVPQIIYYVSAYCDLLGQGKLRRGERFNVAVPTGNFGNILAAVYAREMGIPIARLICASNRNNVLTDFIRTGIYDRNRQFFTTSSPSMDILISSNLERMLSLLYDGDFTAVAGLMEQLAKTGCYSIAPEARKKLQAEFFGGFCDDVGTAETIGETFRNHRYLCDPHTAVALNVYEQYRRETGDGTPCVLASTASPFKFAAAVLPAVQPGTQPADEFGMVEKLAEVTGVPISKPLAGLKNLPVLHTGCVTREKMGLFIRDFLNRR